MQITIPVYLSMFVKATLRNSEFLKVAFTDYDLSPRGG